MNKNSTIAIIVVVVISVVVGIWYEVSNKQTSAPESKESIKIGVIASLSGSTASQGEQFIKGKDFFMEEQGSKYNEIIKFIVEDSQGTSVGAISAINKLINIDNVNIIIGYLSSTEALSIVPILKEKKVLFFAVGTSSSKLSGAGKYIFRHALLSSLQAEAIAEFIYKQNKENKNICVFYLNDETGKGYYDNFVASLSKNGGNVRVAEMFDKVDSDFRTQITKFKKENCEILYSPATPQTLGLFLKQANEMKFAPEIMGTYGIETDEFIKIAGEAAEGVIYTGIKVDSEFLKKFKQEYDEYPKLGNILAYDSLAILLEAIEKVGNDSDKISSYFENMEIKIGISGKLYFNSQHDVIKEMILKTVKNGQFVPYEEQ